MDNLTNSQQIEPQTQESSNSKTNSNSKNKNLKLNTNTSQAPQNSIILNKCSKSHNVFNTPQTNQQLSELTGLNIPVFNLDGDSKVDSKAELIQFAQSQKKQIQKFKLENKAFMIGLTGGTCAGKSQLVKMFCHQLKRFTNKVQVIDMASFYKKPPKDVLENRQKFENYLDNTDFDHPDEIDFESLKKALNCIIQQKPYNIPVYDKIQEKIVNSQKLISQPDVVIVVGTLALYNEEIRQLYDLKLFLDTDEDIRLSRRVYQDVYKRNKNCQQVIEKYLKKIKPDFENFVLPVKKYADIIIPNFGGDFIMKNYPKNNDGVQNTNHTHGLSYLAEDDGFSKFDTGIIDMIIEQIGKKIQKYDSLRTQKYDQLKQFSKNNNI